MAYRYMMHVFCDECASPHPTGIVIQTHEIVSPDQSVGDIYDGREVPSELVTMSNNTFTCPNTGKPYTQRDNSQLFLVREPDWITGQTFEGQTISVDNRQYVDCTFLGCRLVYGATGGVGFKNCTFDGCEWVFVGSARLVLHFMALMHSMGGGGTDLIEGTFDLIRAGYGITKPPTPPS